MVRVIFTNNSEPDQSITNNRIVGEVSRFLKLFTGEQHLSMQSSNYSHADMNELIEELLQIFDSDKLLFDIVRTIRLWTRQTRETLLTIASRNN